MALNTTEQNGRGGKRTYLSINHGKVIKSNVNGSKEVFSSVDGTLETIYSKKSVFGSEEVVRWFIDLRDGEELYSLCLPYASGTFKSIILALASDQSLSPSSMVRIEPYEGSNGYTKIKVWSDGAKLDWITKQLPEVPTRTIGGKTIKDDSKRMEYIISLVNTINKRLNRREN